MKINRYGLFGSGVHPNPNGRYVLFTEHMLALTILGRAVALLEDVSSQNDPDFWRDYFEFTGEHWICTDEGWEPGEAKLSYARLAKEEGIPLDDYILDEVNAPEEE